jgi:hypothetical protein
MQGSDADFGRPECRSTTPPPGASSGTRPVRSATAGFEGGVGVRRKDDGLVLVEGELWAGGDGKIGGFRGDVGFGEMASAVRGGGGVRTPLVGPSFDRRAE